MEPLRGDQGRRTVPGPCLLDVGFSSGGFVETIRESLPSSRRGEVAHAKLRMDPHHVINILDTPLGSTSVPGTPAAGPGCTPAVQQALGAGYAAGVRNVATISQSERQPPGKLLTTCITTLLDMMSTFDIFSNLSQWSFQTLITKVEQYAAQLVCDEIALEWAPGLRHRRRRSSTGCRGPPGKS